MHSNNNKDKQNKPRSLNELLKVVKKPDIPEPPIRLVKESLFDPKPKNNKKS
jgi:hypothetical protein